MEYITITNKELVELYRGLEDVKDIKGTRFSVIVAKNLKEITHQLKELEELAKPSDEFNRISMEVHKAAENEDKETIEKIEAENKDLIEERKKQIEVVDAKMNDEVKVALHFIKEDSLPQDLTSEQLLPLLSIIK